MTKKKETPIEIEEAVIVEDIQETVLESQLPAIPEKFFVEGKEYSLAVVDELDERAKKLIKKATPDTYENKKIWDEIFDLKQEAVKLRTIPENKRKEYSKPVNDFLKELKSKTDKIGDAAKAVQDSLDALLTKKENWEEEKRKEEEAKIEKRTNQRISDLYGIGGKFNPDNNSYILNESAVIAKIQIQEFDDEEWSELFAEYKADYEAEQKRIADEKEQAEKEAAELKTKADALADKQLKMRRKELDLMGAEFIGGAWVINAVVFAPEDLVDLTFEEWEEKIELASIPVEEEEIASAAETADEAEADSLPPEGYTSSVSAPIDPLEAIVQEKVNEHVEHQNKVDGKVSITFEFSPEQPYIEHNFAGTSLIRLFPAEYEAEATDIKKEWVLGTGGIEELGLYSITYKRKR